MTVTLLYEDMNIMAEHRGRVVKTPASYSGGPGVSSRPGDRLSCLKFSVVFLILPRQMAG
jgi:hypothetical protein